MKILALEFSSERRSVALLAASSAAPTFLAQHQTITGRDTPACDMIGRVMAEAGITRDAIEVVAVGLGPGSATGVRAAIAFAQGWQLARGVRVCGFSSLQVMAEQLHAAGRRDRVWLAVDAQRGDFHITGFALAKAGVTEVAPLRLAKPEELRQRIIQGEPVLGPGLAAAISGAEDLFPEAASLARLAARADASVPGARLEPIHLRETRFVKATTPRFAP